MRSPFLFPAFAAALALVLLSGCASGPQANPADPFEPFNRGVYRFNDGVDRAVLKPVATVYRDITPQPVRTGVTNFFGNLSDVWSGVNSALQLKPQQTVETVMRVGINTIFGFAGVIDLASEMRLRKHSEDFGLTLGHWGVDSGPYVVLPLLGPSSVRDSLGKVVDAQADLVSNYHDVRTRNTLGATPVVNLRANLLDAGQALEEAALDKYSFTRDVYLQRRRSLVGKDEPDSAEVEERFDLPEVAAPGAVPAQ